MSRSEVTLSAIPNEITAEGQNYINTALYFGKYAPQPPPDIVRLDEAGPDWERPPNQGPIGIFRRAPTYDLNDYSGGFGVYMRDANAKPYEEKFVNIYGTFRPTIMLNDIIRENRRALIMWIYTYLLQSPRLSLYLATKYLVQIANNDAEYPTDLLEIVKSTIDQLENRSPDNIIAAIVRKIPQLQLYIPRNLILPELQSTEIREITPVEEFLFGNIYWLRYFRPERLRLNPIIDNFTQVDLYLVTANLFERYPGRKLLSYYNDQDLYRKFGRIGKFFFPKVYSSKRLQLDGIMGMSLHPFGYFTVENWSRPIRITYHRSEIPLGPETTWIFDLDTLVNSNFQLKNLPIDTLMPLLRLGIQVESNWPFILDKEAWIPFINMVNSNAKILYQEYKELRSTPIINVSTDTIISLPNNFDSLEQRYLTCLLCEQIRPLGDFSLCGHGTCLTCQSLLGTAKCPFCSEHFTADNLNDDFVRILQSDLGKNVRNSLQDKIQQVNNLKQQRAFQFDWANGEITLFTG